MLSLRRSSLFGSLWVEGGAILGVDAAAALMADDVTYLDVIVGEPQKGRDAARDKVIKLFVTAVPDLTWKMTGEPIESANGVAFEFTFAGTNTGAWGPAKAATGKPFSFNGVTSCGSRTARSSIRATGMTASASRSSWVRFSSRPDDFAALGERGVRCLCVPDRKVCFWH